MDSMIECTTVRTPESVPSSVPRHVYTNKYRKLTKVLMCAVCRAARTSRLLSLFSFFFLSSRLDFSQLLVFRFPTINSSRPPCACCARAAGPSLLPKPTKILKTAKAGSDYCAIECCRPLGFQRSVTCNIDNRFHTDTPVQICRARVELVNRFSTLLRVCSRSRSLQLFNLSMVSISPLRRHSCPSYLACGTTIPRARGYRPCRGSGIRTLSRDQFMISICLITDTRKSVPSIMLINLVMLRIHDHSKLFAQ